MTYDQNSAGIDGVAGAGDRFGEGLGCVAGAAERSFLVSVPFDVEFCGGMVNVISLPGGSNRSWRPGAGGIRRRRGWRGPVVGGLAPPEKGALQRAALRLSRVVNLMRSRRCLGCPTARRFLRLLAASTPNRSAKACSIFVTISVRESPRVTFVNRRVLSCSGDGSIANTEADTAV